MDLESVRVRRHAIGTVIVVVVLVAFQLAQGAVDPIFVLTVAVLYFLFRCALDLVWTPGSTA